MSVEVAGRHLPFINVTRQGTCRNESGNRTYIITAKRMISGDVLKYRNRFLIEGLYETRPRLKRVSLDIARSLTTNEVTNQNSSSRTALSLERPRATQ